MADIAEIGFRADTTQLAAANDNLQGLTKTAAGAERATDRFSGAVERAERRSSVLARALGGLGNAFRTVQGQVAGFVSSLLAGVAFGAMIDGALKLSSAIAELSTLLPAGSKELEKFKAAARGFADDFGSNTQTQVAAFYQALSAGAKDASALVESANRLAIGGVAKLSDSIDVLSIATNAYARTNLQALDASDTLFIGVLAGVTTVSELSSQLGQVIPIAAALGVSFSELTAGVAALTTQGLSTGTAVTSLRAILSGVAKPSDEASKLAKKLGIDFSVTALQAKGLAKFLSEIVAKTGGSASALSILFGSVEALNAALAFAGAGGDKFAEILTQMENRSGATDEAFNKMAQSIDFRWNKILAAAGNKAIDFGSTILEYMVPAIEKLIAHSNEIGQVLTVLAVGGLAVAIKGAISLAAAMTADAVAAIAASRAFVGYTAMVASMGVTSATAAAGVTLLGVALRGVASFILGPWGIAIAGAIAAYMYFSSATESASQKLKEQAAAAGAGGAKYLELRSAAEEAANAQDRVRDNANGAAGGLSNASGESERLRQNLIKLGLEADYTAIKLAKVGLQNARNRYNTAKQRDAEMRQRNQSNTTGILAGPGAAQARSYEDSVIAQELKDARREAEIAADTANRVAAEANAAVARARTKSDGAATGTSPSISLDDDAKKKGGRGRHEKSSAEKFSDLTQTAQANVASLQAEIAALGMADEAAAKLKHETDMLNQAKQQNINLTPTMREQIGTLAGTMAQLEMKLRDMKGFKEMMDGAKESRTVLEQERDMIGLVGEAAMTAKYRYDLLTEARQKHINLTPEMIARIDAEASALGKLASGNESSRQYTDLNNSIRESIWNLKAEAETIGMSEEAAARHMMAMRLLNDERYRGIKYSDTEKAELIEAAGDQAYLTEKINKTREAYEFAKGSFRGFLGDLKTGLMEGKSAWQTFSGAVMNLLDRLIDRLLDMAVEAAFATKPGQGAGGGGILGAITSIATSVASIMSGSASGSETGAMPKNTSNSVKFARGGVFTDSVVSRATPFRMGEMGEAGPEAIVPLTRGPDGSLGVQMYGGPGASGGLTVNVEVNNDNRVTGAVSSADIVEMQRTASENTKNEIRRSLPQIIAQYQTDGTLV